MGDAAKNPFVLPIFDTNYTVDLVWPAGDTIDVGMLKMGEWKGWRFLKEDGSKFMLNQNLQ